MTGIYHCSMCGKMYHGTELQELGKMGKYFLYLGDIRESHEIICPDCQYRWNRMSEDEKFDALNEDGGMRHEEESENLVLEGSSDRLEHRSADLRTDLDT